MDEYKKAIRATWDEWTPIHARSAFYDLAGFKAGRSSLMAIEREELGDVRGKRLLHLQCHFGMDTLSWARLGAQVTGVDFSEKAIALATSLSEELGLDATFVRSDVSELPAVLDGEFDIVFTSYGVLPWLPDLARWGQVIGHFLRPGGTFYIVEGHPFAYVFDTDETGMLRLANPYFHTDEPIAYKPEASYADTTPIEQPVTYEWTHSLSDVLNALIAAGLRIEFLHEFPFSFFRALPILEHREDGRWWLPTSVPAVPLTFSLRAVKE